MNLPDNRQSTLPEWMMPQVDNRCRNVEIAYRGNIRPTGSAVHNALTPKTDQCRKRGRDQIHIYPLQQREEIIQQRRWEVIRLRQERAYYNKTVSPSSSQAPPVNQRKTVAAKQCIITSDNSTAAPSNHNLTWLSPKTTRTLIYSAQNPRKKKSVSWYDETAPTQQPKQLTFKVVSSSCQLKFGSAFELGDT